MKPKSWRDLLLPAWEYYQEHSTGGALHIVLDDGNIEDSHVEFCIRWASGLEERGPTEVDEAGVALGRLLLAASRTQRDKLRQHYSLYCWGAPRPEAVVTASAR